MAQLDFSGLGTKPKMVSRGPQRSWLAVAVSLSVFALLAAMVMVASNNRQPTELENETVSLFKSALASQRSELKKQREAEAKAKEQAKEIAEGISGGKKQSMSDAALFKEAVKEQTAELKKAEAKRAKLSAAAKEGSGNNALPSSRSEQLSDAKLFQDAIKEQHEEMNRDKMALKHGLQAAMKKSERAAMMSKAAQKAKVNEELREILGAAGDNTNIVQGGKKKGVTLKATHTQSATKAREEELASIEKKLPVPHHAKAKKVVKPAKPAPQMLSKNAEKSLVELLTGASGDQKAHVKHAAAAKLAQKKLNQHKTAATPVAAKKPVVATKASAAKAAGSSLKQAIVSADSKLHMTHTAQSYKEEEVLRSDAIEKKLLGEI